MCAVASAAESVIVIDKTRRDESEQHQHEHLSLPSGKKFLKHRDRTVAVRTFLSHAPVHWQSTEQGEKVRAPKLRTVDNSTGARGARNTGLVTQRRKIIDAGKAHYLPPRVLMMPALGSCGPSISPTSLNSHRPKRLRF
jgi:hypothetical protein